MGKIWFPTSLQIESSRKQSASRPPHSLLRISSVISWSWDWVHDFKFHRWNIIRKCRHKYVIAGYQCKQFTRAQKSPLIDWPNVSLWGEWERGGGAGDRENLQKGSMITILSPLCLFQELFFSILLKNVKEKKSETILKWNCRYVIPYAHVIDP